MTRSSILPAVLLALLPAAAQALTISTSPNILFNEVGTSFSLAEGKAYAWREGSRYVWGEYRNNAFSYKQSWPNWTGSEDKNNDYIGINPTGNGTIDPFNYKPIRDGMENDDSFALGISGFTDHRPLGADTEVGAGLADLYVFHLGSDISGEYEVHVDGPGVESRTYTDNPAGAEVSNLFRGYLPSCPPSYAIDDIMTDGNNVPESINAAIVDGRYLAFSLLPSWQDSDQAFAAFSITATNGYGSSSAILTVRLYPYAFNASIEVDGEPDPAIGGWLQLNVTSGSMTDILDGDGERRCIAGAPGQQVFFEAACDGYAYEFKGWKVRGSEYPGLGGITVFNKTWEELLEMGGMPPDGREGPDIAAVFTAANKSTLTVRVNGEGNATPRRATLAVGGSTEVIVTEWCAPFQGFEDIQGRTTQELLNTQPIGLGGLANETNRYTYRVTMHENNSIVRATFASPDDPWPDDDDDDDGGGGGGGGTVWPDDDDDDDDYEPPPPPPGQVYLIIGTRGDGRATPNQVNVAPRTPVQVTFQELGASFKGPVIQTGEATMEAVSQGGSDYAAQYVYNIAPITNTTIVAPFLREEYPPTVTAYDVRLSKRGSGSAAPQAFRLPPGRSTLITLSEINSTLIGVEVVSGRADLALLDTTGASLSRVHRYGVGGVGMPTEILATFQDAGGPPPGTKYKLTIKKAGRGSTTPSSVQVESWQRVTVVCQESGGVFKKLELVDGVAQLGAPTTSGTTMGARTYSYPVSSVQKATTLLATFEGGGDDDDDDGGDDDDDDDGGGGGGGGKGDDDDDEVNPLVPAAGAAGLLLLKQKQNLYRPHWSTERPDTPWDARKRGE